MDNRRLFKLSNPEAIFREFMRAGRDGTGSNDDSVIEQIDHPGLSVGPSPVHVGTEGSRLHPLDRLGRSRSRGSRSSESRSPAAGSASANGRRSPTIAYSVKSPGQILHDAVDREDFEGVCRILRASPDCVDARNERGRTPLHIAAQIGRNDIVKELISKGAQVDARSKWKYTPLIFASEAVHSDVINTLVRAGADLRAITINGNTPLHRAVLREKNNPMTVLLLLMLEAPVDSKNEKGLTVLQRAVSHGHYFNVLALCAFGADTLLKNEHNKDAQYYADRLDGVPPEARRKMKELLLSWGPATGKQREMKKVLPQLAEFVDKEHGEVQFNAMLCWAAEKGHETVVEFVLQLSEKLSPSIVKSEGQRRGWQPLHHAARGGESKIVEILINHGADVDSTTCFHKWTPLLLAAEKGRQRTVRVLLDKGADILAKGVQGYTAFDVAATGQHTRTLEVLLQYSHRLEDVKRRDLALKLYNATQARQEGKGGPRLPSQNVYTIIDATEGKQRISKDMSAVIPNQGPTSESSSSEDEADKRAASEPGGFQYDQISMNGSFDGSLYSSPSNFPPPQSRTLKTLIGRWDFFNFKPKHDRPIRVAVIDTGLDLTHQDFVHPRLLGFKDGMPDWATQPELSQYERIRECKDFTGTIPCHTKDEMIDLDGHGTQVAGLILRYAPHSELYIARICEGDANGCETHPVARPGDTIKRPRPDIVSQAIDWAIQKEVHIINLSFGFPSGHKALKDALKKARKAQILVFAAMSNDGNNSLAAWPARDSRLAIGVHSCVEGGKRSSDFTPIPVYGSHNFMFVGENVLTHWPEAKGGGFRLVEGTSYSTPIVAAMAALILAFADQHICKMEKEAAHKFIDIDELHELDSMAKVLGKLSNEAYEKRSYSYIHPELLWADWNSETGVSSREWAWSKIIDALSR